MKIAIGCDHIVTEIKNEVRDELISRGIEVYDVGTYDEVRTHYPIYGQRVGLAVSHGIVDYGIVICGTGVGISMAAQKIKGTRGGLVGDVSAVKNMREQYDANFIAMGGRVSGIGAIMDMVDTFLQTEYLGENDKVIHKINNFGVSNEIDFNPFLIKWNNGEYKD